MLCEKAQGKWGEILIFASLTGSPFASMSGNK